jgi:hypothetical protein
VYGAGIGSASPHFLADLQGWPKYRHSSGSGDGPPILPRARKTRNRAWCRSTVGEPWAIGADIDHDRFSALPRPWSALWRKSLVHPASPLERHSAEGRLRGMKGSSRQQGCAAVMAPKAVSRCDNCAAGLLGLVVGRRRRKPVRQRNPPLNRPQAWFLTTTLIASSIRSRAYLSAVGNSSSGKVWVWISRASKRFCFINAIAR